MSSKNKANNGNEGLHLICKDMEVSRSGELVLDESTQYEFTIYVKEYLDEIEEIYKEIEALKSTGATADDAKIAKLLSEKDKIPGKYNDVKFIYALVKNGINFSSDIARKTDCGYKMTITLPQALVGGGKVYLEAIREGQQPKNVPPYGIFVAAKGTPEVLGIRWTDYSDNLIKETVAPNSYVLLHIYTQNMYGHDLEITLMDDDKIPGDSDDRLADKEDDNEPEIGGSEIYRVEAEANVYPISAYELKGAELVDLFSTNKETLRYVQKAIVPVRISNGELWKKAAGRVVKELDVYPKVYSREAQRFVYNKDENFLNVSYKGGKTLQPEFDKTRKPVTINQVNTRPNAFGPCYYTTIKAKVDDLSEILLFDEKDSKLNVAQSFILPVVAGVKGNVANISIELDTNTDNCYLDNTPKDHEGKVVNLSGLSKYAKRGTVNGQYIGWDATNNIEQKTDGGVDENAVMKWLNERGEGSIGTNINLRGDVKLKNLVDNLILLSKSQPFKLNASDRAIDLDVNYSFSDYNNQNFFIQLVKSFYPIHASNVQVYPITLDTCRYQKKKLEVHIYPDIRWTVQLAVNYSQEKFNNVIHAYHTENERQAQTITEGLEALKKDKYNNPDGSKKAYNEKAATSQQIKSNEKELAKANAKNSPAGTTKETFDKLEWDDALERDLIDFELGLVCEFDKIKDIEITTSNQQENYKQKTEISRAFPEIADFIRKVASIKKKVDDILDGKNTNGSPSLNENSTINNRMNLLNKKMEGREGNMNTPKSINGKSKKPSNWTYEFIPPQIGASLSWHAERPERVNTPNMGLSVEGKIDIQNLIGFEVKYDIFALLAKAHPVVRGIVLTLNVLDELAGDNFDIELNFVLTGRTYGSGKGKLNTLLKGLYYGKDDKALSLGGSIAIAIEGRVYGSTRVDNTFWSKITDADTAYIKMIGSISSEIALEGELAADEQGNLNWAKKFVFMGLVLKGSFTAGVILDDQEGGEKVEDDEKAPEKPMEKPMDNKGLHFTAEGKLVIINPEEWHF